MFPSTVNSKNLNKKEIDPLLHPVVKAKPDRAREMISKSLPGGAGQKTKDEIYHEGYVDGKLFIVPDRNLEAMKDIVNYKMRPKRSFRYKHQTSFELSGYDHFMEKLNELLEKVNENGAEDVLSEKNYKTLDSVQMVEDIKECESEENKNVAEDSPSEKIEEKPESIEMYEDVKDSYSAEEKKSEKSLLLQSKEELKYEEDKKIPEDRESSSKEIEDIISEEIIATHNVLPLESEPSKPERDLNYLRFLVSGHIKRDHKPIFIIQIYDDKPYLFKEDEADIFSSKKEHNIEIVIAGKFYSENIMEESEGKPVALKIEPNKIVLDENKIQVFENDLENIFKMQNYDVLVKGEFIKSEATSRLTPFISLGIQCSDSRPIDSSQGKGIYNNIKNTTVLIFESKHNIPFSQNSKQGEDAKKSSCDTNSIVLTNYPISPQTNTQLLMEENVTDKNEQHSGKNHLKETKNTMKGKGFFHHLKGNSLYKTLFTKVNSEGINNQNERDQKSNQMCVIQSNKWFKSLSNNLIRNALISLKQNSKEKPRINRIKTTIQTVTPQN